MLTITSPPLKGAGGMLVKGGMLQNRQIKLKK